MRQPPLQACRRRCRPPPCDAALQPARLLCRLAPTPPSPLLLLLLVAGVDGGTESIRAGVFDLAGTPLSFASEPYPTAFPRPGWAEQNPADWWAGLGGAVRAAVASAGIQPTDVAALCVDTTCCTVVALDATGDALRPALLWMDMRSAPQAAKVRPRAVGCWC